MAAARWRAWFGFPLHSCLTLTVRTQLRYRRLAIGKSICRRIPPPPGLIIVYRSSLPAVVFLGWRVHVFIGINCWSWRICWVHFPFPGSVVLAMVCLSLILFIASPFLPLSPSCPFASDPHITRCFLCVLRGNSCTVSKRSSFISRFKLLARWVF